MNRTSPLHSAIHAIPVALLSLVLLSAGMCRQAEQAATDDVPARSEEALAAERAAAEAEAAAAAEMERQAALAAAEQQLAEREARLQAEREELARQRALAEKERLAAERAAAAERERQLAARERELREREEQIAEREQALATEPELPQPAGTYDEPWREQRAAQPTATAPSAAAPPPAEPRPAKASLQPGKVMEVEFLDTLTSRTSRVGDIFSARLVHDLRNADGVLVVPAGSKVLGRVTEVTPLRKVGGQASLGIEFTDIVVPPDQRVGIRASFVELGADKRKDKKKIAAGAVAGAVLGHILGGDGSKNVLIGAAVGAAAGTAVVAGAKDKDAEIPAGEKVALQLEEVVTVEIRYGAPVGG